MRKEDKRRNRVTQERTKAREERKRTEKKKKSKKKEKRKKKHLQTITLVVIRADSLWIIIYNNSFMT